MSALLSMEDVTGGYGDADILENVSLNVSQDEIVVIVGPNGAGKSTAMKSVFGLLTIRGGRLLFDGDDITRWAPQPDRPARDLLRAAGRQHLPGNVDPREPGNGRLPENRRSVRSLRPRLQPFFPDLKERRKTMAGRLSGGQRQMVAMGRALMLDPKLLLLDEPTAGLSPRYMEQIFQICRDVRDAGVAILLVEQHAKQALAFADRGYVLAAGRNRHEGTGAELLADREVAEMFLGGLSGMDLFDLINFYVIPGIVLGSIYALGAVGITLIFAIMRYAHLAHGDLATLGAFIALAAVTSLGISPMAALPIAIIGTAGVAVGIDKLFYEHLRERPKIVTVMASLGIALMVRSVIQVVWGVDTQTYSRGIVRPEDYFGFRIRDREFYTVIAMLVLVGGLQLFLTRSKWGKAMRAMSDNPNLALLSGIDNKKVVILTWMIAGGPVRGGRVLSRVQHRTQVDDGLAHAAADVRRRHSGGASAASRAPFWAGSSSASPKSCRCWCCRANTRPPWLFAILLFMLLVRPTGLLRGKVL
ncbi:ATP-binding cassette domain-containing protein [Roseibium salinum]|nr:ATP-binding cassette domain-containing protein [Roseibium salinum]